MLSLARSRLFLLAAFGGGGLALVLTTFAFRVSCGG